MPRDKGKEWDHVKVVSELPNKSYVVQCLYCEKEFCGASNRIRAHIGVDTLNGVAKCKKIPAEVLAKFNAAQSEKAKVEKEILQKRMLNEFWHSTPSASSSCTSNEGLKDAKQQKISVAFRNVQKGEVDAAVARMCYSTGASFNIVNNLYFKQMCKKIGEYGSSYTPPTDYPIRTTLLDKEYQAVQNRVNEATGNLKRTLGTIVSDGWSDAQRRPLLNILLVIPEGATFISSIDSSGFTKDSKYIAETIISAVAKIGPNLIMQVITDNAANCKGAWDLITKTYTHITCSGCAAHTLDLLLEDWGKVAWIGSIVTDANTVVKFITGHEGSRSLLRSHSPNKGLIKPGETRFGTNVIMIQRLVELKDELQEMVASRAYKAWIQNKGYKDTSNAVCETILSQLFWSRCQMYLDLHNPVYELLRLVDGESPVIGKLYYRMFQIQKIINGFPNVSDAQRRELYQRFLSRWTMLHNPLHAAAFLLDPEFIEMDQHTNQEVMTGFYTLVERLHTDVQEQVLIATQLTQFRSAHGIFGLPVAKASANTMPAYQWWINFGSSIPELQGLAVKVLSQTASSSAAERNWSLFGFFQNKRRASLKPSTTEKMVYVHANTRLLDKITDVDYDEPNAEWVTEDHESDSE